MTDFTITINDKPMLLGITAAREAYNAALPNVHDEKGNPVDPVPGTIDSDEGYLQMVIEGAARSYAKQHGTDVTEIDSKITELQAKRAAVMAKEK